MNTRRDKKTIETDRRISAMLRGEAAPVPEDGWFVRKTLNRLPPDRRPIISLPEKFGLAAAVMSSLIVGHRELVRFLSCSNPFEFNFAMFALAVVAMLAAVVYSVCILVRRA